MLLHMRSMIMFLFIDWLPVFGKIKGIHVGYYGIPHFLRDG